MRMKDFVSTAKSQDTCLGVVGGGQDVVWGVEKVTILLKIALRNKKNEEGVTNQEEDGDLKAEIGETPSKIIMGEVIP